MNIGGVSRSIEIYQSSVPVKSPPQVKKTVDKGNDTITLSETAKDFKTVLESLKTVSDVREDKVAKLREDMASNNYKINASDISERILKTNFDAFL